MAFLTKTVIALASAGMFFTLGGPAMGQKTDLDVNSQPLSYSNSSGSHFAAEAASGGMMEVKLGQLAVQKSSNDQVKMFGQRMVDDHSRANDQLMGLASKDNLTLPSQMNSKDQATYDRLSKLSGSIFDRAYINDMMSIHEKDIAAFQHEANDGKNSDLKTWAANTLPMLRDHLRLAKDTASSLGYVSSNYFSRK